MKKIIRWLTVLFKSGSPQKEPMSVRDKIEAELLLRQDELVSLKLEKTKCGEELRTLRGKIDGRKAEERSLMFDLQRHKNSYDRGVETAKEEAMATAERIRRERDNIAMLEETLSQIKDYYEGVRGRLNGLSCTISKLEHEIRMYDLRIRVGELDGKDSKESEALKEASMTTALDRLNKAKDKEHDDIDRLLKPEEDPFTLLEEKE